MRASEFGGKVPDAVGRWCWSTNEATFHGAFATKEEAIAEGKAHPAKVIYVGRGVEVSISGADADDVIEELQASADGEVGYGYTEDFLWHVPRATRRELDQALRRVTGEWLTKHNLWPTFFTVVDVEKVEVEKPDAVAATDAAPGPPIPVPKVVLDAMHEGYRLSEIAVRQGIRFDPETTERIVRDHVSLKPMRELLARLVECGS